MPFPLPNDISTKWLTSLVAIYSALGQFDYPKAEKTGSKDAFEKAFGITDEWSDSQRKGQATKQAGQDTRPPYV